MGSGVSGFPGLGFRATEQSTLEGFWGFRV